MMQRGRAAGDELPEDAATLGLASLRRSEVAAVHGLGGALARRLEGAGPRRRTTYPPTALPAGPDSAARLSALGEPVGPVHRLQTGGAYVEVPSASGLGEVGRVAGSQAADYIAVPSAAVRPVDVEPLDLPAGRPSPSSGWPPRLKYGPWGGPCWAS